MHGCTWCTHLAADTSFSRSKPTYARQLLDQAAVRDTEDVKGIAALTTDFPLDFSLDIPLVSLGLIKFWIVPVTQLFGNSVSLGLRDNRSR